ncbi:MAG TPA: proteasome accessory factor PafA2 family protein [Pyrinomonadaceae bacterium]|nr:proteasome accessory factor PafA2 family protein [Pyrinomonadaceae bacterium]
MTRRLFGMETEYAVGGHTRLNGSPTAQHALVWQLIDVARAQLKHLRDFGEGMFLENGSRLYVDAGYHPELTTPECADPSDVVRYILAGEKILLDLAAKLEAKDPQSVFSFFKCNVDYSGAGTTWGCHESYMHSMSPGKLSDEIIPHLVSRIIYTGAGGFDSVSPGLVFTLSPRVPHLENVMSEHSTSARGIFHTKDEPLSSGGYHRLHLICGESLCSQTSMWLKVATTALVVLMAEAGLNISDTVRLSAPLTALKGFAADPHCKSQAIVAGSRWMTAIEIQRVYLKCAEEHLRAGFMPDWAEDACRQWRMILDRLERGHEAVNTTLDWAIKLALYKDYAARQGFSWETLPHWTHVHKRLDAAMGCPPDYGRAIKMETLFEEDGPVRNAARALWSYMKKHELRWDDLNKFLRLRRELFEIDTRFGQLGEKGIFSNLSASGVLHHEMKQVGDIQRCVTTPPQSGRARLRGEFIHRVAAHRDSYYCDWQGIWDRLDKRLLDLSDPFASKEQWRKLEEGGADKFKPIPEGLREAVRYLEGYTYY